ncbi:MAG TPA: methenyltetrahydromethanopterin cyclohydrolase [Methylophilus sp.]|nr:methenyltetrahydromethanopterin cyclohydrolase [Methylophilus sp.]HQQ33647.1 methenyltetrahydromethanopterin cyclohydrolase [Methylophilus sp.]
MTSNTTGWPSVNLLTNPLVERLILNTDALRIAVKQLSSGCTIIDAGIEVTGSLEAGRLIAEICMGGLGNVSFTQNNTFRNWQTHIQVHANNPVLACLGSQYAGWSLSHEKFFSLGSGPARAVAQREELFKELAYKDSADMTVLVLETDQIPPNEVVEKVAHDTGVAAKDLTFILTPTRSLAGVVQIVGRVLEVALHKAHTLHFPLECIVDGIASAPLPPPAPNFITGMGRTNDAILYGGQVHLYVKGDDDAAKQLAETMPSNTSKDYGKPFAETFKAVNMDFYKIDPLLFSPAKVTVSNIETGHTFAAGSLNEEIINQSFK